jgi:NAD(P)-dependent dehydrogenase (short-subunit alcohol dehydrogenase family)
LDTQGVAAIVTGGASGLGRATAEFLAEHGCKVAILDTNVESGEQVAAAIGGVFQQVDVTCELSIEDAVSAAEAVHGVARILVSCAGIAPVAKIVDNTGEPHSAELLRKIIGINLIGAALVQACFAARLAKVSPVGEERGVVINTASIAAYEGQVGQSAYAASKAGVVGLTLPSARDLAPHRIRVMAIAPGMFRTPMIDMLSEEGKDQLGQQVPFPNRLGTPKEFAQLVLSIINNPMLNGEVIRLDAAHRLGA